MAKTSLKIVGEDLAVNGYEFVPLRKNEKRPIFKDWTNLDFDSEYATWIARHPDAGAGIITSKTPAVDLDITNDSLVEEMADFVELCYGSAPTRIGLAPKRLMVFRLQGKKFVTLKSAWLDEEGVKHEVQILGDGQQFVGYGVHPNTGKPYRWVANGDPTTVDWGDLPRLSEQQGIEILEEFDRLCEKRGWTHKIHHRLDDDRDYDDPNAEYEEDDWVNKAYESGRSYEGDYDDLERKVMLLPNADDYHQWIKVIAALQTGIEDQERAYDIALKWSAQANNFDQNEFDKKWEEGFRHDRNKLISFRSLLQEAHEIEEQQRAEAVERIIPTFMEATTRDEWMTAAGQFRNAKVTGLARADVIKIAADRYKEITGRKLAPGEIKKSLSFRIDPDDLPGWLVPWVFNTATGDFINIRNGAVMKVQAFDLSMSRYMANDADSTPVKLAMEVFQVPTIEGVMYNPIMHGELPNSEWKPVRECANRPEFFRFFESQNMAYSADNGKVFLNTFRPDTLIDMPDEVSKRDKKNIAIMKDFFAVQFPDAREREYVMEYIAWCIKHPGRRINYALIIHGCPGSGKTILSEMFRCILGDANVGAVSNSDLQSSFTRWAEGDIVKFVEEVSVIGHGYDVLNNIKDKITNPIISVRRMREDSLKVQNTASYIMVTNDPAALPIDSNDRRYLIVASQFQDKQRDLVPFLKNEPNFFRRFDRAFRQSPGAMRKWFHEFSFRKDFKPDGGHAPEDTRARERMIDMSKDDFTESIMSATYDGDVMSVTPDLIYMPDMLNWMEKNISNFKAPTSKTLSRKMESIGYYKVGSGTGGQVRFNGSKGSCYAKHPKHYEQMTGLPDSSKIREHLEAHNEKFGGEDEDFDENDQL